jgi:hypothetical protein
MTFDEFMRQVNRHLANSLMGLDSECIADYMYYDAWKAGDTPKDCAACALKNARDSF